MSTLVTGLDEWLIRTTIGGGVVLLAGALWMLISRQPAQRQRIGELALLFALLVAVLAALPSWWSLSPSKTELAFADDALATRTSFNHDHSVSPKNDNDVSRWDDEEDPEIITLLDPVQAEHSTIEKEDPKPCVQSANECTEPSSSWNFMEEPILLWTFRIFGAIYLLLVGAFFIRCGCGYYGLWRYWRQRRPAPAHVIRVLEELAPDPESQPRIGVCSFVHGPVSYGIWKPTILLPPEYCNEGDPEKLRWILAHELTHLQRRDAWGCLLLAVGGAVYFHLPWFWWLKRHVRLAQEYVADAAAAKIASAVDYAQYLLSLTTLAKEPTLASGHAAGVFESHSDLYRRVHMLLRQRNLVEGSCPRWWTFSAAASFLVLAACSAGVGVQADEPGQKREVVVTVVNDDDKKSDDKKAEKKQEFRIVIDEKDGKGTHVFRIDDGKVVEDKSGDKKMVWRLAGGDGDVQKKIDEAMKKIDQALERLPKDGASDARARLEEVKNLLKKMRDNKGAVGFAFGDGNAFQWQGKEQFGQWRKMVDDEREKAEKARDLALEAVRRQRVQAQDEQKARRDEVEARLKTARARLKEGKMDKDEAIQELEKAIAEKEAVLKKLKDAERKGADERDKKAVQDFLSKDLLAARGAEARAQAEDAKARADVAVARARRLAEVNAQGARAKGGESSSSAKGRLGITMSSVDSNLRNYLDIPEGQGVFITEVFDPSAAWNNGRGMKSSDILVEFAGKKVSSDPEKFRDVISNTSEGTYEAVVIRKGRRTTLSNIKLPGQEKKERKSSPKDGDDASGDKQQRIEFKVAPSGEVLKVNPDTIKLHVDGLTTLGGLKTLDKDAIKGDIVLKLDDVKKDLKNLDGDIKAKVELLQPQLDKLGENVKAHIELVKPEIDKGVLRVTGQLAKPDVAAGLHTITAQPLKLLLHDGQDGSGKPRLGVQMETVPESIASQIDLADDRGLMVREVIEGSAAEKAGFQKGDIITMFANKPVTRDASEFHDTIKGLKSGTYTATVLRKGKEVRIRNIRLEDAAKVKEQDKTKAKDWTVEGDKKETEDKDEKTTAKRKTKDDFFPRNNNFNVIGANKQTSVSINNGEFTLKQKDEGKSLTVTGTIVNGKPSPKTITLKDGDTEKEYKSVNEVPQPQRREVEQALRGISGGGNNMVRFGNPNFQFGDINAAQMKHIQDAMKELQKQLGQDNPAFQQMEEEMKRLEKELKRLRDGKGGDDKN
jgi:hypothetical protein